MNALNISYLPHPGRSHLYVRAWGKQVLRALGFAGLDLVERETELWEAAERIAEVSEHADVQQLYATLVQLAVQGRGGLLDGE